MRMFSRVMLLALVFAASARAEVDKKTERTWKAKCASCHGAEGKGDGPVAPALATALPDLTTIAQRNGGVFPTARVRKIIVGDESVLGHGSREMPVWGPLFHQVEEDRDYGEVRLQNVTEYLKSIQK